MGRRTETGRASEKRGRIAEWLAVLLLAAKGYRILGRRVRTRAGEIDLIAKSLGGIVCFVEVKARTSEGLAAEAVGQRQRGRIVRAAQLYMAGKRGAIRFDMITVLPGHFPRHLKDAWRADDIN